MTRDVVFFFLAVQGIAFEAFANSSKRQRNVRFKDGALVVTAAEKRSKAPSHGNEKTASRRLQVVSNAAASAPSAAGLLIPLSIVGTDHDDDFEEDKLADAFNQLLIKKSKKERKKKAAAAAARVVEADGEITVTAKILDSNKAGARVASSLSSSSPSNYDSTLVDLIDQLESIRLHALALERWHAPQLKKVHR